MADGETIGVGVCCCILLIILIVVAGGIFSDHEDSSTDIKVNSSSSSSSYTSTSNPSTSTSSSKNSYTGYQSIEIKEMYIEDDLNLANRAGWGYIGTLIPKGKPIVIKLYESDWNEIMRQTNGNPIGKTIYVELEHDEFEKKWDGDDFYYIEDI